MNLAFCKKIQSAWTVCNWSDTRRRQLSNFWCVTFQIILIAQILDRKNSEIEELKSHYKSKEKEYEENKRKLEKKGERPITKRDFRPFISKSSTEVRL